MNTISNKKIRIFLITLLYIAGCDVGVFDTRFKMLNETNSIITTVVENDTVTTSWEEHFRGNNYFDFYRIGEVDCDISPDTTWETALKYYFKESTVYVFVFDSALLMKYKNDSNVSFDKLYKRYDFSFDEILKNNWKVTLK